MQDFDADEDLRKTCSSIYVTTSGDEWYRMVAELQWGKTFWEEAFARSSRRRHKSFKDEIMKIGRIQHALEKTNQPLWELREFRAFWMYEKSVRVPMCIRSSMFDED